MPLTQRLFAACKDDPPRSLLSDANERYASVRREKICTAPHAMIKYACAGAEDAQNGADPNARDVDNRPSLQANAACMHAAVQRVCE